MTVFEAYNTTKKRIEKSGIEDFVFEAKQIIKHITGMNATQILTNYNKNLTQYEENNLTAILRQREIRYPLQYIFGEWDFYGNSFFVGPGVLSPRADTETLIDVAKDFLNGKENPHILDLCAGSGCIGITLAKEFKNSKVLMVEKFSEAIHYLEKNIARNATENATVLKGDIFCSDGADKKYSLIVSNPPYIEQSEMSLISPETKFEPETALIANDGGIEFYKAIIGNYKSCLEDGGMILFEVGFNQSEIVAALLKDNGFTDIKITKDLNEIGRAVSGIMERGKENG